MAFIQIAIIILASIILVKSTHWVIKSLYYLAQYFHVPKFVMAFILAGLATSFPELFVGISSGLNKTPILSLANVFGSNIANLTLVLGITVIFVKGISSESRIIGRNIIYTLLLIIYPILLASDGLISRVDGAGLLVLFVLYNAILFFQSREFEKKLVGARRKDLIKNILVFAIGISLLMLSAEIIVRASSKLAIELNIPLFLIGLFLVAVGTSLPEIIFGIRAGIDKQKDMILGNILGSLASNSTAVLGVTAIIAPIMITRINLLTSSSFYLLAAYILFMIFARSDKKLTRQEGLVLLFFYISFIIIQFMIG
ncbi:sodium:calcium antiporter [Patescibacteria group bacterium AH-259-L07]|nr:sodium:calcium antiporter [Patescibacteria group bacterium AH-259-L07]